MKFFITPIVYIAFVACCSAQTDTKTEIIENYLKTNYESDIYFHMWDTTKIFIRRPTTFYYSDEIISMNFKRFYKQIHNPFQENKKLTISKKLSFKNSVGKEDRTVFDTETGQLRTTKYQPEEISYIVFNTGLVEGKYVMVEVFFKRIEQLHYKGDTEYKTYKPMNGGISYLFIFNDSGCLSEIYKEPFAYD